MAATSFTPISLYYSSTATNVPTSGNLVAGELAINTADGKLFYKDSSGVVQVLATKATTAGTFTTVTTSTLTSPSATALTIQSAGTTAITVDTSQNVGIGTASPTAKLNVTGHSSNIGATFDKGATTQYGINYKNSAQTYTQYIDINNNGTNYWTLYDTTNAQIITQYVPGASGSNAFYTAGTERMRIDSSGNLLVGTTTNTTNTKATFSYDGNSVNGMGIIDSTGTTAGTRYSMFFQRGTGTTVGSISTTTSTTSFNTSSDYRLKENIAPMTGALDVVQALKPVTYKWKIDGSDGQGFIAHELQAIVPDCVTGKKDAVDEDGNPKYQGIDTSFLVATLTAAIQEQQALIESLTTRLTALESK